MWKKTGEDFGKTIMDGLSKNNKKDRKKNKYAYGELKGNQIGFMDNLTLVRINKERYKYFNNNKCIFLD